MQDRVAGILVKVKCAWEYAMSFKPLPYVQLSRHLFSTSPKLQSLTINQICEAKTNLAEFHFCKEFAALAGNQRRTLVLRTEWPHECYLANFKQRSQTFCFITAINRILRLPLRIFRCVPCLSLATFQSMKIPDK